MKRWKKLLALMLALVMVLSLAACAPAEPAASQPQESVPEEKPAEPEKEAEPYTITVSMQSEPGAQEAWEAVAAGYEALHPEADVVIDLKAVDGYSEWVKAIGADYKNNTVDIVAGNLITVRPKGMCINWNEYMEEVNPYDPEGRIWKECFNYGSQKRSSEDGSFDLLNLNSVQINWFYNKDIFAEVGVEAPETWDELVEVCEKIDAAGYQALAIGGAANEFATGRFAKLTQIYADQTNRSDVEIYRAHEGDYCFDPDVDGKWQLDITDPWNDDHIFVNRNPVRFWQAVRDGVLSANTPGTAAVWENFCKLFPKYAGGDAFFGTTDPLPLFYQGKAAITLDVAGFAVTFNNTMKKAAAGEEVVSRGTTIEGIQPFELGMFKNPSMTNASGKWGEDELFQAPARTFERAVGFLGAFSRNAEQDAHLVDFMQYYSSSVGMTEYVKAGLDNNWTPPGASQVYGVAYPEEIQKVFTGLEQIGNCQKDYCNAFARGLAGSEESSRKHYELAQQCLLGEISPAQYAEEMAAQHLYYFDACLPKTISPADLDHPEVEPVGQKKS